MADATFPYAVAPSGRTATSGAGEHLRELIEQFLLTMPGERVNRPTFGGGLMHLVFEPGSEALSATVQATVHGALQQWLGDRIDVESVAVTMEGSVLQAEVAWRDRLTQQPFKARFQRSV